MNKLILPAAPALLSRKAWTAFLICLLAVGVLAPVLNLLVPADLPAQPWTAVIVAELLAADNNTVVFSSSTAARAFAPR